jgi:hypothetical protein
MNFQAGCFVKGTGRFNLSFAENNKNSPNDTFFTTLCKFQHAPKNTRNDSPNESQVLKTIVKSILCADGKMSENILEI